MHGMYPIPYLFAVRQPTAGEAPLAKLRRVPPRVALPAAAQALSKLLAAPVRVSLSRSKMSAACFDLCHCTTCCDCRKLHPVLSFYGQGMHLLVSLK